MPHQRRLPDRRRRLLLRDRARPPAEAEARGAGHDRPGGDQGHLPPLLHRGRQFVGHVVDEPRREALARRGDERGPTLTTTRRARVSGRRAPMATREGARPPPDEPGSPSPVTADTAQKGRPRSAQNAARRSRRPSAEASSASSPATTCGRAASSGNRRRARASPPRSRPRVRGPSRGPGRSHGAGPASARCGAGSDARAPGPRPRPR